MQIENINKGKEKAQQMNEILLDFTQNALYMDEMQHLGMIDFKFFFPKVN